MNAAKPVWTLLLAPLTAVVIFAAYRAITQHLAGEPADISRGWSAARPIEPSPSSAREANDESVDAQSATVPSTGTASLSPAQQEIAAMSETFRNTTLLMAIRQSGYVCEHMLGADRGAADVAAWRVRCSEAVAYLVGVDAAGNLSVGPMTYGDGLAPAPYLPDSQFPERNPMRLDQLQ